MNLIRGRYHPALPPVLRIHTPYTTPPCQADGPWHVDPSGDDWCWPCDRVAGHTGRHFAWTWEDGRTYEGARVILAEVWTDDQSSAYVSDGREVTP